MFLSRIMTCDKKWIMYNNIKRSYQWLSQDQPPSAAPKADLHVKKILLSARWTMAGMVYYDLLDPGQTIDADVYCQQLQRASNALAKMKPSIGNRYKVILLHDNARSHTV